MARKQRYQKKKDSHKRIAKERISHLFEQAFSAYNKDPKRSNRYVELARKIAMKYKVKFPSALKRQFCKHCYVYLMPGDNCLIRLTGKTITYSCKVCKKFSRIGYKQKKEKNKEDKKVKIKQKKT